MLPIPFSSLSSALSSPSLMPFSPTCFLPCSLFLYLPLTCPPYVLSAFIDCQFEIGGWDGVIRSSQVEEEERVKPGDALDCIWTIRAPPQSKVSTRGLLVIRNDGMCCFFPILQPMFDILEFIHSTLIQNFKQLWFRLYSMLLFRWHVFKTILKHLTI